IGLDQARRDFDEVERLRTDDYGHRQRRRLEDVVAADRHQAAADEGNVSRGVEAQQFAERIDYEALRVHRRAAVFAARARDETEAAAFLRDRLEAFRMARHENQ